ncbi:MAG TPA: glycosyltransferase [Chitinophagaceae bacterium]|jgi:glycosyltransferase involved in cell wall biosynthesis|nr:glycosyltransferase [Chitinophagaceae bacterium]
MPGTDRLIVLIPVYNDWSALEQLLPPLYRMIRTDPEQGVELVLVNDGSPVAPEGSLYREKNTTLLHLTHNIGHQKALAIGLSYIHHHLPGDRVLILDADGDDRPEDAARLLAESLRQPDTIIAGRRARRQEGTGRRLSYYLYLWLFRTLTGQVIRFGNFCVLPFRSISPLVHKGDIWHHLPGGILKSKLPLMMVPTEKGRRKEGRSHMSYGALVYHAIGAIAAFIDVIAIRLLLFSGFAILLSVLSLVAILVIRLTTELAIPGWASMLGASLVIILLLSFLIALFLVFTFITAQSYRKFVPALHYQEFIGRIERSEA